MKQFCKKTILLLFFLANNAQLNATHIVGGELYYSYLGNNRYAIELRVYRDCYTGVPFFDNPASIGFFNLNNNLYIERCVPLLAFGLIPPTITSPCFIPPIDVCYQWSIYRDTVILAPVSGGYQLAYQRCCRNFSILNIQTPLDVGITIYAKTPSDIAYAQNSNPVFDTLPPPFMCLGFPFVWDNSATDKEGDSLVYELCVPFDGGEGMFNNSCPINVPIPACGNGNWICGPAPHPPFNPPYSTVTWQFPFSLANLLGGIPMAIDPQTGVLTCTPNTVGQFVYGVCVREYRNNILLSRTRRDFQANVVPCPSLVVAALQTPIISCGSNAITFQNSSFGASTYFWNFGDPTQTNDTSHAVNPTYVYPDTGFYNVMLIAYSTLNGCADTTFGEVHLFPPFNADFTFTLSPCTLAVSFNSTSVNTGSGFANSWLWNFGDNTTSNLQNPVHTYPNGGTYTVILTVHSDSGCVDVIQKTFTLTQPVNATISVAQSVSCTNDCNAIAALTMTSGVPPFTYQWNDPNNQTTQIATGLCAGTYSVLITDSNNCTVTKTITINNPPPLSLAISSTDAYCGGRCYGTATGIPSGGTPPVTYSWNDPQNQTTQTASDLCPGIYTVVITDDHGCTFIDSVEVLYSNYIPPLNASVSANTIFEGQTIQLFSTVYQSGTYNWAPPTGLNSTTISNPTGSPVSNITYIVIYIDANGCENSDSVTIVVREVTCIEPELFIPNAFTPNDDSNNDILYVRGATIKELLLRIYDRWGEKVFETIHPSQGWDGTYKGKPVLPGVYDYYFEATCYNNEKFFKKGNVTVIR